jgi:Trypsin
VLPLFFADSAYDSGSPIIVPGNNGEPDVLVGLVSWGEGCADPDFPGVNARVSDAFEWLRVNVCVMSDDPPYYLCAPPTTTEPPLEPTRPSDSNSSTATTTFVEPVRWADLVWKMATVVLGIVCVALLCERSRPKLLPRIGSRKRFLDSLPHSSSRKRFLDSPGSSIDEVEGLNADGPHLNRYESLQGVEVSTFSAAP